ncbi:MAG: hypothetical protein EXR27_01825 [Betaproteobacteria bacterium]|nr:hypothetical protein [Betaproteobacteria bacterium]
MSRRDAGLDALLILDGETFFADEEGTLWVKFDVKEVSVTAQRPHGLIYSLTLHDERGARLLGFDNAHAIREGSEPVKNYKNIRTTWSTVRALVR